MTSKKRRFSNHESIGRGSAHGFFALFRPLAAQAFPRLLDGLGLFLQFLEPAWTSPESLDYGLDIRNNAINLAHFRPPLVVPAHIIDFSFRKKMESGLRLNLENQIENKLLKPI